MSKRVLNHPEVPISERTTKVWRSAGELEGSPLFQSWLQREFPQDASTLTEEEREMSRRNFGKLMGASAALAGLGLSSCRRPEAYIVPYKEAPEWVIPGKPLYYATTVPRAGGAVPVVAETYEGRPMKLGANESCREGCGTDAFVQASVLNLYDPFRSKFFLKSGETCEAIEFEAFLSELVGSGSRMAFVFGEDESPTRLRLIEELKQKFPGSKAYRYEALENHSSEEVLGEGVRTVVDFTQAERILSFDCDFLGLEERGSMKGYFDGRQGGAHEDDKAYAHPLDPKKMNRLYQVEAIYSLTGGMADHRLRVSPSQVAQIAAAVAAELGVGGISAPQLSEKEAIWVKECAADLKQHAGHAFAMAGSRHGKEVHQLVAAINQAVGAYDKVVKLVQTEVKGLGTFDDLVADLESGVADTLVLMGPSNPVYDSPAEVDFAELMKKAKVSIHWGLRTDATAYAADWHVPAAHYLESWGDGRTSGGAYGMTQPIILPLFGGIGELELLSAFLGDGSFQLGDEQTPSAGHDEVRKTFEERFGKEKETWLEALKDGVVDTNYAEAAAPQVSEVTLPDRVEATKDSLEVIFGADASVWDGRYIDNSWLQEAPDPISKLTWDNVAYVSPKTAKALGVAERIVELQPKSKLLGIEVENAPRPDIGEGEGARAPMMRVTIGGRELELPVLVSFGMAENTIFLPLGYGQAADDGRTGAMEFSEEKPVVGDVGLNVGFDCYRLRTGATPFLAVGATAVSVKNKSYPVALTQEHHAMYGRALAREISTDDIDGKDYAHQLKGGHGVTKQGMDSHMPPNMSIYKPDDDKGKPLISDDRHQWAMAVDLNVCTGCNACLVACQAENNIPVVGKEQVAKGREMHWVRMDRYYAVYEDGGDEDNPEMIPQPVSCVQCELAPCETVCPVNATVHNEEGLNVMAYNRCIGTRYCANNCPYKARRFNFFDYNKRNPLVKKNLYKGPWGEKQEGDVRHLQRNPNVSVRMRGVMEKCTYCVQRLESAKIKQKQIQRKKALTTASTELKVSAEDLRVPVDSVKVACQTSCSSGAITFGNLLDKDSAAVVRAKSSDRNYDLLNYIGTLPRTSYLARVKNPNPKIIKAGLDKNVGRATIHIH
ncbi:MAG: TAT-variant-translocated molybdopterin oxidoreductase [Verrucomicrobiota bacterium]